MARKSSSRKAAPSSASSIQALRERGMSDAAIGRAIGRDSSLIGQVAKGKKPGRNLERALDALVNNRRFREPERRKTKSGLPALVRDSDVKQIDKKSAKALLRNLDLMAVRNQGASFEANWGNIDQVRYRGVVITAGNRALFSKGGENPKNLAKRLRKFIKKHPDLSDEEQFVQFMQREYQKLDRAAGDTSRFSLKNARYKDLRSVSLIKKERTARKPHSKRVAR